MANYKVRVIIFNGDTEEVSEQEDFHVQVDNGTNRVTTFDDILVQLSSKEVDWTLLSVITKSHERLVTMLKDVQSLVNDVNAIFQSGNYADLLKLQDRVKLDTGIVPSTLQEALLIDVTKVTKERR